MVCPTAGLALVAVQWARIDLVARLTPLDISGTCSAAAVEDFFGNRALSQLLGLGSHDMSSEDAGAAIGRLDLAPARRLRANLAAQSVPACLQGARDEQVALADQVIGGVEAVSSHDATSYDQLRGSWILMGIGLHLQRLHDAEDRLRQRMNLTPSEAGRP